MAGTKRRCATCRYFQDAGMGGNGWCTHPDRQTTTDVRIFVRAAELACRNAWGSDLWAAKGTDNVTQVPQAPRQPSLPNPPVMPVSYDDEVTSVVNADTRSSGASVAGDDVVQQTFVQRDDDDFEDTEQDERRKLLYHDSRSAIERARERARQRHMQGVRETPAEPEAVEEPIDTTSDVDDAFPPDDYVEEESPSTPPTIEDNEDGVITETIRSHSPRSRRLRKSAESSLDPKDGGATMMTDSAPDTEIPLPPSDQPDRGRFDSIPARSAEVDLDSVRRRPSRPILAARPAVEDSESPVMPDLADEATVIRATPLAQTGTSTAIHGTGTSKPKKPAVTFSRTNTRMVEQEPAPAKSEGRRSWWRGNAPAEKRAAAIAEAEEAERRKVAEEQHRLLREQREREAAIRARAQRSVVAEPAAEASATVESRDVVRHAPITIARKRVEVEIPEPDSAVTVRPAEHPAVNPVIAAREVVRESRRQVRPAIHAELEATTEPVSRPEPRQASDFVRPTANVERREETFAIRQPVVHIADDDPLSYLEADSGEDLEREFVAAQTVRPQAPSREMRDIAPRENDTDGPLTIPVVSIAPEVTRACHTCRSYRASEQGGRGWCTNSWAFTHRQMVNDTDLPCTSTLGSWWLPADTETWDTDDEPQRGPTPRVDKLIARKRGPQDNRPARRVVGD